MFAFAPDGTLCLSTGNQVGSHIYRVTGGVPSPIYSAPTESIAGLDFDPFLGSQDPGERYEVGTIAQKGSSQWADIHGVWAAQRSSSTDVVAELVLQDGHWTFVNFHYPDGSALLTILKLLREGRQKSTH